MQIVSTDESYGSLTHEAYTFVVRPWLRSTVGYPVVTWAARKANQHLQWLGHPDSIILIPSTDVEYFSRHELAFTHRFAFPAVCWRKSGEFTCVYDTGRKVTHRNSIDRFVAWSAHLLGVEKKADVLGERKE